MADPVIYNDIEEDEGRLDSSAGYSSDSGDSSDDSSSEYENGDNSVRENEVEGANVSLMFWCFLML
jgi:hypothetical protein